MPEPITPSRLDRELHLFAMQRLRERDGNMSAPDQRITMLVNVCREAIKQAEDASHRDYGTEPPTWADTGSGWRTCLPPWHAKMVAVLRQFEDIK